MGNSQKMKGGQVPIRQPVHETVVGPGDELIRQRDDPDADRRPLRREFVSGQSARACEGGAETNYPNDNECKVLRR
jgi:hypothetical protein